MKIRRKKKMEMYMTKLWYLASPYTHKNKRKMHTRFKQISKLAGILQKKRVHVLCPIASSVPIAKYADISSTKWKDWRALDINLLSRCDGILIATLDNEWHRSIGMKAEFEWAIKKGLPVKVITSEGKILNDCDEYWIRYWFNQD